MCIRYATSPDTVDSIPSPPPTMKEYAPDQVEDAEAAIGDLTSVRQNSMQCPLVGFAITDRSRDSNGNSRFAVRLYSTNQDTGRTTDVTSHIAAVSRTSVFKDGLRFQCSSGMILSHLEALTDNIVYYPID